MPVAAAHRRKVKIIAIAIAAVLAFGLLYTLGILAYFADTNTRKVVIQPQNAEEKDYVRVEIKVMAVDLNKGTMDLRAALIPKGSFVDAQGELTEEIHFLITSSSGAWDRVMLKGQFPTPQDASTELSGTVTHYPWDDHIGGVEVAVTGPKVEGQVPELLPTQIVFEGDIAGLNISAAVQNGGRTDTSAIIVRVQRSPVVQVVVIFSMILLWVLTATVVAMVVAVLIGNKIEMVMFPFIGTILFSMIAFRNGLPGAPAIGALSDYMAFFWGYTLVVLALLALMITWLHRLPKKRLRAESDGENLTP